MDSWSCDLDIDSKVRPAFFADWQAGVDLSTVKLISGHKNLTMVERYSRQNGAHIQTAMDKPSGRYKAKPI